MTNTQQRGYVPHSPSPSLKLLLREEPDGTSHSTKHGVLSLRWVVCSKREPETLLAVLAFALCKKIALTLN